MGTEIKKTLKQKLLPGNLVVNANNDICEVQAALEGCVCVVINHGDGEVFSYKYDGISGVPLSSKLLEHTCQFIVQERCAGVMILYSFEKLRCTYYTEQSVLRFFMGGIYFDLEYLHELQNLFSLMKIESSINM